MIPHTAHRATQFTMHGTKNESLLMWIHELTQTAKGGGGGGGDGAGDEWGMTSDRLPPSHPHPARPRGPRPPSR